MMKLAHTVIICMLCFVQSQGGEKVEFVNSSIIQKPHLDEEEIQPIPEPLTGDKMPTTAPTPEATQSTQKTSTKTVIPAPQNQKDVKQKLALSGRNPPQAGEIEIAPIPQEKIDRPDVCKDHKKYIDGVCDYCGNTEYYDRELLQCQIVAAGFEQCSWNHTFGLDDICPIGSCKCYGSDGKAGVCEFGAHTLDHTYANCIDVPRTSTPSFVPNKRLQTTPSTELPSSSTTARTESSKPATTPATTTTATLKGTTTTTTIPPTTPKNEIPPHPNENLGWLYVALKCGIGLIIVFLCLITCYHCCKIYRR